MGQFVHCLWPDEHQLHFLATITKVNRKDNTYDVFFPEDKERLKSVKAKDIIIDKTNEFSHQNSLINKTFYDEGSRKSLGDDENFKPGEFIVKKFKRDLRKNRLSYLCQRVVFDESDEDDWNEFDMSYVIKRVRKYDEDSLL